MTRALVLICLSVLCSAAAFSQDSLTVLPTVQVESWDVKRSESLFHLFNTHPCGDLLAISTTEGFALWRGMVGYKAGIHWFTWYDDDYDLNDMQHIDLKSIDFVDITEDGTPEMIFRLSGVQNGSRGGSEHESIKIWDPVKKTRLLSIATFEHFGWFASDHDDQGCKREVTYSAGQITIGPLECYGGMSEFSTIEYGSVNEPAPGTYVLDSGVFKLQE